MVELASVAVVLLVYFGAGKIKERMEDIRYGGGLKWKTIECQQCGKKMKVLSGNPRVCDECNDKSE